MIERALDKDDFRGNAKRSTGKITKKLLTEIKAEALRGFKLSGLDYVGIDVIEHNDGNYSFLEFNPVPGFEQVEELSEVNVARELIQKLF